jgi:hypothetical protein
MELYAHVPEATDRDVAVHLDASWNDAHATAGGTIGQVTGTADSTNDSDRALRRQTRRSVEVMVEVMGLEPTTSTCERRPRPPTPSGLSWLFMEKGRWRARFRSSILTAGDPDVPGVPVATGTRRARTCFRRASGSGTIRIRDRMHSR